MKLPLVVASVLASLVLSSSASPAPRDGMSSASAVKRDGNPKPKVFIISMFAPEGEAWYGIPDFDVLADNITVPGFSPLYPQAHCTADGEVCQLTTGEAEINAAVTISSLIWSDLFDLTTTYFMIAGIAGVNPMEGTLGSVTFARYAVQVALQYEFDAREIPANFSTGYVPQGAFSPGQYIGDAYGSEVFEVNENLRELAVAFASKATLNDSTDAQAYRANYGANTAAAQAPSVIQKHCDVATSDTYFSGDLLSEALGDSLMTFTNGSGVYCTTAQEDNATLEAMVRGALAKLVAFDRIIVMRTCSDFDRPYPGEAATTNLFYANTGGFEPSIENIYLAGVEVVNGILAEWNTTFSAGVPASNYIGDILGTLGGTPDYGPGSEFDGQPAPLKYRKVKRGLPSRRQREMI